MTSVIHSMVHVAQTLRDFGPIQNYSTFNFESAIGMFLKITNYYADYLDHFILKKILLMTS